MALDMHRARQLLTAILESSPPCSLKGCAGLWHDWEHCPIQFALALGPGYLIK